MHPRSDLVVLAARREEQAVYLDVLRDWSSLGLVADFILVDAEGEQNLKGSPCLAVSGGRVRPALLQEELARRPVTGAAHVACLSHMGETFSTMGSHRALQLSHEVRDALPAAIVTRIHLIGVARQARTSSVPPAELAWQGAHNVVLAPENAQSPRAGVAPIVGGAASSVTHIHLAAGLCSAVGLWVADRRTAFHGEPDGAGARLVALRTYTRHLSARSVESKLVENVMDVQRGYPVPMVDGMPAQRLEDETGAAIAMGDRLLAKHPTVLAGQRQSPMVSEGQPISFLKAVGMMVRFLGKALIGAPKAFMNRLVHAASAGLASATQAFAFGSESAYVVTVRGIRGIKRDGSVASAEEMDSEIGRLLGQLTGQPGSVPPEHHDLTGLWTDFTRGGLTLLDGMKRSEGLDPVSRGSGLGVVTTPHVVVPAPQDTFEVASDLSGYAKTERVSPYDIDAARRTYDFLGEQATEHPQVAAQLSQEQARLRDWFADREATYTGRVGSRLYGELTRTRTEIAEYAQELSTAQAQQDVPHEIADTQTALAKLLVLLTGGWLLALLLLVGLGYRDVVSWEQSSASIAAVLVLWLGSATAVFRQKQKKLFHLLHRRQAAAERLGVVKANLADALIDLRRLQRTYRQFVDWSRALGTFIQAPWGQHEVKTDPEAVLGTGYPHNHRFGTALADEDAVEQVAARLRPQIFPVGWTNRPWDAFVADLPSIGGDTHFLEDDHNLIYSDRAVSSRSILTQWSEAVAGREWTGGYAQVLRELQEALKKDVDVHRQRLLGRVSTLTIEGEASTETYDEFMAGLQGDPVAGAFSRGLFTDIPETVEPWRVGEALATDTHDEFNSSLVLTQLSVGFNPRDLRFVERQQTVSALTQPVPFTPEQAPQV